MATDRETGERAEEPNCGLIDSHAKRAESRRGWKNYLVCGILGLVGVGLAFLGVETHLHAKDQIKGRPDYDRRTELGTRFSRAKNLHELAKDPKYLEELHLFTRERQLANRLRTKPEWSVIDLDDPERVRRYQEMVREYESLCARLEVDPDLTDRGDDNERLGAFLTTIGLMTMVGAALKIK
jgi:hypothetical protein